MKDLKMGGPQKAVPAGLEELFCSDIRHLASSKGRDSVVSELRQFRTDRMKEVREWSVLGMLPGSNSMSIVSSFLHMLMHNANVGLGACMMSALKLFLSGRFCCEGVVTDIFQMG